MNPRRQLGLTSAIALVVSSMIGAGVFITSGELLEILPSPWWVLAAWLGGGVLAGLGALSYGALSRRIPESGGEYLFLSKTLHPAAGFLAGWISLLAGFSAPAALVAFSFGEYLQPWWSWGSPKWSGTALLVFFSIVHALHVQRGAWIQNTIVLLKLLGMGVFIGFAFSQLQIPEASPRPDAPWPVMGGVLVSIFFSYSGWNAAVYIGGEVRNPERNLPLALGCGTLLVTLFYLALNAAFVFSAPVEDLAGEVAIARVAAESLGGKGWGDAVTVIILIALMTSVSSLVMAGPRVYARMATEGYFPRFMAQGDGPPRFAIALQLVVALILLWSATYGSLLTYIGFTLGISAAATVTGLMVLRIKEGPSLWVPGWPWVPLGFLVFEVVITLSSMVSRTRESMVGLATIVVGLILWSLLDTRKKRSGARP